MVVTAIVGAIQDMEVVQAMEGMIVDIVAMVISSRKGKRKKVKVQARIIMEILLVISETTLILNQRSINIEILKTRKMEEIVATMKPAEKKRKDNLKFRFRLKNLLKKQLPNCQNLEREKYNLLLLLHPLTSTLQHLILSTIIILLLPHLSQKICSKWTS